MAVTSKALREKREPSRQTILRMRDLLTDEHPTFTAEEQAEFDKANAEYDRLTAQIKVAERAEAVDAEARQVKPAAIDPAAANYNGDDEQKKRKKEERRKERTEIRRGWLRPGVTEEQRALALQGWMRQQAGKPLKPRHEDALRVCGIDPKKQDLDLRLNHNYRDVVREARARNVESRALSVQLTGTGAATVPEGFVNNLEMALLAYANVRQYADVLRTVTGQDLPWPTVNDTTNKGSRLAENTTVSEKDTTFSLMMLHAYKYTSGLVQVPVELMEDSAFDLAAWLGEAFGIRIGRIQADEFTTGSGAAGVPTGFVTAATSGITAASSTAIAGDDLYGLKHSVDPAYRTQPGVGWVFHDLILKAIKLLKDGFGRYLWQSGLAGGVPDTIDGDPYFINQSMASTITSGNKTVVYGALKKIKIRDVSSVRMRRLVERYADSDQEGFVMFTRADSNLLDAGTHPLKYLVH